MKKQLIISSIFLGFFLINFSGCMDLDVDEGFLQFSILNFEVEPTIIIEGDTANLSWTIIGGKSANIDNGIGNVSMSGCRIIMPESTTTYTLTATNGTTTVSATTQIIVNPAEEPFSNENISISLNISSQNESNNEIKWIVSDIEVDFLEGESLTLELLGEDYSFDLYASISYSDMDLDGYVSISDIFTVVANQDGNYYFRIKGLTTGETLFISALVHY